MAFPDARIRVVSPSEKLPGGGLDFIPEQSKKMTELGFKDGVVAAVEEIERGYAYTLKEYVDHLKMEGILTPEYYYQPVSVDESVNTEYNFPITAME